MEWGGKSLSALLFGVAARDPVVLGAASAFLLLVALAAALGPALRAMRIDPTIAMRADQHRSSRPRQGYAGPV